MKQIQSVRYSPGTQTDQVKNKIFTRVLRTIHRSDDLFWTISFELHRFNMHL